MLFAVEEQLVDVEYSYICHANTSPAIVPCMFSRASKTIRCTLSELYFVKIRLVRAVFFWATCRERYTLTIVDKKGYRNFQFWARRWLNTFRTCSSASAPRPTSLSSMSVCFFARVVLGLTTRGNRKPVGLPPFCQQTRYTVLC